MRFCVCAFNTHAGAFLCRGWSVLAKSCHLWVREWPLPAPAWRLHPVCRCAADRSPSRPAKQEQSIQQMYLQLIHWSRWSNSWSFFFLKQNSLLCWPLSTASCEVRRESISSANSLWQLAWANQSQPELTKMKLETVFAGTAWIIQIKSTSQYGLVQLSNACFKVKI